MPSIVFFFFFQRLIMSGSNLVASLQLSHDILGTISALNLVPLRQVDIETFHRRSANSDLLVAPKHKPKAHQCYLNLFSRETYISLYKMSWLSIIVSFCLHYKINIMVVENTVREPSESECKPCGSIFNSIVASIAKSYQQVCILSSSHSVYIYIARQARR